MRCVLLNGVASMRKWHNFGFCGRCLFSPLLTQLCVECLYLVESRIANVCWTCEVNHIELARVSLTLVLQPIRSSGAGSYSWLQFLSSQSWSMKVLWERLIFWRQCLGFDSRVELMKLNYVILMGFHLLSTLIGQGRGHFVSLLNC